MNATSLRKIYEEEPHFVRKLKDSYFLSDFVGGVENDDQAIAYILLVC